MQYRNTPYLVDEHDRHADDIQGVAAGGDPGRQVRHLEGHHVGLELEGSHGADGGGVAVLLLQHQGHRVQLNRKRYSVDVCVPRMFIAE